MSYATDSDLTTRIPATASVSLSARTLALQDARTFIDDAMYRGRTTRAHVYLAAHFLAVSGLIPGGAAGTIASQAANGIAVSYAVTAHAASDAQLVGTQYGREFVAIRDTIASQAIYVQ